MSTHLLDEPVDTIQHIRLAIQRINLSWKTGMLRMLRIVQNLAFGPVRGPAAPPPQHRLPALELLYPVRDVAFTHDKLRVWRYTDLHVLRVAVRAASGGVLLAQAALHVRGVSEAAREN
jgi:hypothetical protein